MRLGGAATITGVLAAALLIGGCGGGSSEPTKPFSPRATLRAVGGTAHADKPAFVLRVLPRRGDANIRSVELTLPAVVLVDPEQLTNFCTERLLAKNDCAGKKRLGSARATSPAYPRPLAGPAYAVTGGSGRLPRLALILEGGPSPIVLRGKVLSDGAGRIGAGVEDVPDTPLESFEFEIAGGKTGYLTLSRDICRSKAPADAVFESQEGQSVTEKVPLEADCGG